VSDRVKEILAKVDHLPPLPAVVQEILSQLQDPEFSMNRLMGVVRMDPGITAHIIEMCNSPYYGLRTKVSSLQQALVILGSQRLVEMVLSGQMLGALRQGQKGYRLARGDLWRHSMASALLAQRLGEKLGFQEIPALFTAALMHDVGKLILSEYVARDFERIETMVAQGQSFWEAERAVLGETLEDIRHELARAWHLPELTVSLMDATQDELPRHKLVHQASGAQLEVRVAEVGRAHAGMPQTGRDLVRA
jgi:HD-like signal output (HDOD) protein